jgi:hypothetical protein
VTEPLQVRQCLLSVLLLPSAPVNLLLGPIKLLTVRLQFIHLFFVPVQVHGLTDVCLGLPVLLSCDSFQRYTELLSLLGKGLGTGVLGQPPLALSLFNGKANLVFEAWQLPVGTLCLYQARMLLRHISFENLLCNVAKVSMPNLALCFGTAPGRRVRVDQEGNGQI